MKRIIILTLTLILLSSSVFAKGSHNQQAYAQQEAEEYQILNSGCVLPIDWSIKNNCPIKHKRGTALNQFYCRGNNYTMDFQTNCQGEIIWNVTTYDLTTEERQKRNAENTKKNLRWFIPTIVLLIIGLFIQSYYTDKKRGKKK